MLEEDKRSANLNAVLGLREDKAGAVCGGLDEESATSFRPQKLADNENGCDFVGASTAQDGGRANIKTAPSNVENAANKPDGIDWLRMLFFSSVVATICFTAISLAQPTGVFAAEQMHLLTFGVGGLMIILWLLRGAGAKLGLYPDRNIALQREMRQTVHVNWIDGLDEPALLCDKNGVPVQANSSYHKLSEQVMRYAFDDGAIMSLENLFGANEQTKGEIYRMTQSVLKHGQDAKDLNVRLQSGRVRHLPFSVRAAAISHNRILWRMMPINQNADGPVITSDAMFAADDAPIGFLTASADGRVQHINTWMCKLLGLDNDVIGAALEDLFVNFGMKSISAHRKIRNAHAINLDVKTANGRLQRVTAHINWLGEGANALVQMFIIPQSHIIRPSHDIALRTDSTEIIEQDARALIDQAPFGVLTLSGTHIGDAIIDAQNASFATLNQGKDVIGEPLIALFATELSDAPEIATSDMIAERLTDSTFRPVVFQLDVASKPFVQVSVMLGDVGQPLLAYVFDLTEQRDLEERLAQGEKMQAIGQLAGGIAHDFNNVLQGISFNVDELKMRHPVGDPSYENLKGIMEFVERSRTLTRQLLAYAREQTFKHEIFNPTEFLTDFERLLRQTIDSRVTLNILHGEAIPWIKADKNQIETAIINLATNARDAMLDKQNGGQLDIRTFRATGKHAHKLGFNFVDEGDYLLIEVEDNGSGIAPENLQKIFNPFFTTKPADVGTGLGLASVMGIIKQSGGFICPTTEVGTGTIFRIYLPALRDEEVPSVLKNPPLRISSSRPKDITGRGRILFVEDEDGVRGIGANLLRSRGYEVVEAEDGDEAFALIESEPPFDLIISDVVMPGRDGPTLINDAQDMLAQTQVVFISGYADQDLAKKLEAHREIKFLPKPFSMRTLAELVKEMLSSVKKERAA